MPVCPRGLGVPKSGRAHLSFFVRRIHIMNDHDIAEIKTLLKDQRAVSLMMFTQLSQLNAVVMAVMTLRAGDGGEKVERSGEDQQVAAGDHAGAEGEYSEQQRDSSRGRTR